MNSFARIIPTGSFEGGLPYVNGPFGTAMWLLISCWLLVTSYQFSIFSFSSLFSLSISIGSFAVSFFFFWMLDPLFCGEYRSRTDDLLLAKQAL